MDSSQLTRHKRDRYSANALNGVQPHPIFPLDEEKLTSFKHGSKIVTYNKRTILPGCTGPTCNEDLIHQPQGTFVFNQILEVYNNSGAEKVFEAVVDSQNTIYFVESSGGFNPPPAYKLRKLLDGQTVPIDIVTLDNSIGPSFSYLTLDASDNLYYFDYVPSALQYLLHKYDGVSITIFPSSVIINGASGMTINKNTGDIYFASGGGCEIYKTSTTGSTPILLVSGSVGYLDNAVGTNAIFDSPEGLTFDSANNCLYIADTANNCIRKLDLSGTNPVSTYAGNVLLASPPTTGPPSGPSKMQNYNVDRTLSDFNAPTDVEIDQNGNLYIVDTQNNQINFLNTSTGKVTLFAGGLFGTGNPLLDYQFDVPNAIFIKSPTQLYIANQVAGTILLITGSYQ